MQCSDLAGKGDAGCEDSPVLEHQQSGSIFSATLTVDTCLILLPHLSASNQLIRGHATTVCGLDLSEVTPERIQGYNAIGAQYRDTCQTGPAA